MLRRLVAAFLLLLTVSPFTAPFATCDITALLGEDTSFGSGQPSFAPSVEDGSHSVPLSVVSARLRARIRFVSQTAAVSIVPLRSFRPVRLWSSSTPGPLPSQSAARTALRI